MARLDVASVWRLQASAERRGWPWRGLTVAALLVGYAGYYVCRSNLSVAASLIASDPSLPGMSATTLGGIASAGVLAYALGKPVMGVGADLLGGRRLFILGMWGTVAATVAFGAASGVTLIGAAWVANRFMQSAGWGALTKLVAQWFEPEIHGRVIGVLSLSYLFGDAGARLALGSVMGAGYGWRAVFVASAVILATIALVVGVVLRERPSDRGLPEPSDSPLTAYAGATAAPSALGLVGPLVATPTFWFVCALSCGLTLVREAFNIWIPTFLTATYAMPADAAARWSALFPLMGGVSVIAVGAATDALGPGRRMAVATPLVLLAGVLAWGTASDFVMHDVRLGLVCVGGIAVLLLGPYSLLAGAMALELGGQRGAATAAGLIDTAGYLGAILSGVAVGAIADAFGWAASLRLLGAVTIGAAGVSAALAVAERRRRQRDTPFTRS